jgi:hypothetical protein
MRESVRVITTRKPGRTDTAADRHRRVAGVRTVAQFADRPAAGRRRRWGRGRF